MSGVRSYETEASATLRGGGRDGSPVPIADVILPAFTEIVRLGEARLTSNVLSALDDVHEPQHAPEPLLTGFSELLSELAANNNARICELTEHALRYSYLRNRELVIISEPTLPLQALQVVIDFSSRFTIIGIVEGNLVPEVIDQLAITYKGKPQDHKHHLFIFSPYANLIAPFFSQEPFITDIRITRESELYRLTISSISSPTEPRRKLSISGPSGLSPQEDFNVATLHPFSSSEEDDARILFPKTIVMPGHGTRLLYAQDETDTDERAQLVFSGRDSAVLDLLEDLTTLTHEGSQASLASHTLEERYETSSQSKPKLRAILRRAIDELATKGRVSSSTADPLMLPAHVLAPTEAEYADVTRVMSYLQVALDRTDAAKDSSIHQQLLTIWNQLDTRQKYLLPEVRTSLKKIEHRFGELKSDGSAQGRHWIFYAYITAFASDDPKELQRGLERQIALLRVINKLHNHHLALTYRLFTVRTEADDLEAVFEVSCTVDSCDSATADSLRESFGELVHSTYVGIYGISFGFDDPGAQSSEYRLDRARFRASFQRTVQGEDVVPFRGRPDWGHLVDYLRSLEWPAGIEMTVRAGHGMPRVVQRTAPQTTKTSLDQSHEALALAIANVADSPETVNLQIQVFSDQNLSAALKDFVGEEISGGPEFKVIENDEPHEGLEITNYTLGEAISIFHPPFGEYFTTGKRSIRTEVPIPVERFPLGGSYLGRARRRHAKADRWVPVRLPSRDRLLHTYIVGRTGSGKTNLLKSMAAADLESPQTGLAIIDPHGDLSGYVLNRIPRTRVAEIQALDFSDPEVVPVLNPLLLDRHDNLQRARITQEILELLKSRTYHEFTGPRFDESVRLVLDTMLDSGYPLAPSLVDVPLILTNGDAQSYVRSKLVSRDLVSRWNFYDTLKETRDYADVLDWVVSKFDELLQDDTLRCFLGGARNTVDIERSVAENGILLVTVPESVVGRQTAEFIGSLILIRLRSALLGRGRKDWSGRRPAPYFLYVDEFQKFASTGFHDLVAEARKFGVGVILAHQNLEQLNEFSIRSGQTNRQLLNSILGNVGNIVVFGVGAMDAETLSAQLSVESDIVMRIGRHEALAKLTLDGTQLPSFTLRTDYAQPVLNLRLQDDIRAAMIKGKVLVSRISLQAIIADRHEVLISAGEISHPDTAGDRDDSESPILKDWLTRWQESENATSPGVHVDSAIDASSGTSEIDGKKRPQISKVNSSFSSWAALLGPLVRLDQLAHRWGISEQSLARRARRGQLLILTTRDGVRAVPLSHLREGGIIPGLEPVIRRLQATDMTDWTKAAWLASPQRVLGNESVLGWLGSGGEVAMIESLIKALSEYQ